MKPYEFSFVAGKGRTDCECSYLLDLDKIAAIGNAYFDEDDWIAYVDIHFDKGELTLRALTGFGVMPGFENNCYGHYDKEYQKIEFQRFSNTVQKLKDAWLGGQQPQRS